MSITRELAAVLARVDRGGSYCCAGRIETLAPRIVVDAVGTLALPLQPAQAKELIKAATRAPYGRGADTIVDTSVRRTWQIGSERVHLGGKHWPTTLADIVARVAAGLGVTGPVHADLYKLLVYEKGSFFVGHRDTEKAAGMFATLVVALPSQSEGGELVVRHQGQETKVDLGSGEASELAFAAFYADCVHEVLPVVSGYRVTLVFNLVRSGKGSVPKPPGFDAEIEELTRRLRAWVAIPRPITPDADDVPDRNPGSGPEKIVYLLQHAYTPAELAFDRLKGADAGVASVLTAAAARSDCDLHLALLEVWESGSAEYNGNYRRRYRRGSGDGDEEGRDNDEFEVVEVHESGRTLSEWRRADGEPAGLGPLPLVEGEVSPPTVLDDMKPDEENFREATGNEGASFERTYRRAALVVWPSARILAVLNQAGARSTLPYLEMLIGKWQAERTAKISPARDAAVTLAGHMLATWRLDLWQRWYDEDRRNEPSDLGQLLGLLARLGDHGLVEVAIEILTRQRGHAGADNDGIVAALGGLPISRAAELLRALVAAGTAQSPKAAAGLLTGALRRHARKPEVLLPAGEALVAALPGAPETAPRDDWGRAIETRIDATCAAEIVAAVDRIGADLAKRTAAHMLAWPNHFGLDMVLLPAVKRLVEARAKGKAARPAFDALRAAVIAHLDRRMAEPLAPPSDWERANGLQCNCKHCASLGRFLIAPDQETWMLKAVQSDRSHVEAQIQLASADVTVRTERRGSPHTLVCVKNQASYQRRVAQRRQDEADHAELVS